MTKKAKNQPGKKSLAVDKMRPSQWRLNPLNNAAMDYHVYEMTGTEKFLTLVIGFFLGGAVGLIFYGGLFKNQGDPTIMTYIANAVVFAVAGLVGSVIFVRIREASLLEKRQKDLRKQFRDMLESVTTSLAAGETTIQSFNNAYVDMKNIYTDSSYITEELRQIILADKNNVELEKMLDDFAERSDNEDIESFASVFKISYRQGGRMSEVMRQTHDLISEKMEIEDEIESKIASNKLELNLISLSPIAIVLMLRLTNPSFAERFATMSGVLASTAAIMIFVIAYFMGRKIIMIRR